jgi:hypothetical protein
MATENPSNVAQVNCCAADRSRATRSKSARFAFPDVFADAGPTLRSGDQQSSLRNIMLNAVMNPGLAVR